MRDDDDFIGRTLEGGDDPGERSFVRRLVGDDPEPQRAKCLGVAAYGENCRGSGITHRTGNSFCHRDTCYQ